MFAWTPLETCHDKTGHYQPFLEKGHCLPSLGGFFLLLTPPPWVFLVTAFKSTHRARARSFTGLNWINVTALGVSPNGTG